MSRNVTINSGEVYSRLTVLSYEYTHRKRRYYKCECLCGKSIILAASHIKSGHTKSCGCQRRDVSRLAIDAIRPDYYLGAGISPRNNTITRYKSQAKRRGIEYLLTTEEFISITQQNCHYCGSKPSNVCTSDKDSNNTFVYNGIDRKDNDVGYTIENCVPCCKVCNRAKNSMSYDEFIQWINRLVTHERV